MSSVSIKCPGCGLVNFADAEACRRCKKPLGPAAAAQDAPPPVLGPDHAGQSPASGTAPVVLGRVTTKHGFKDLSVVALEDCVVLIPESLLGSVLHNASPMGAAGGIAGVLIASKAATMADASKRNLAAASADKLKADPNHVVFPLADLVSIQFTRNVFSAWVEFVRPDGPTRFEVNYQVYTEFCDATERRFPALYRADERTAKLLEKRRAKQ
jgi:hypothetical protein